jgi:RNA polymerase sporulation-specific sigma factor
LKSQDSGLTDKYESFSDEELICRLRDGESEINEYILNKYKNLVRAKAKTMYILGADSEDLIQEGMIGLFKAVKDYDPGRDASFLTFAELCVSRQMYTAVTASGRKKHLPLNSYISIYAGEDGEEGTPTVAETVSAGNDSNPEELVIDKENVERIEKLIETELSAFEKQTIELYLVGMNYTEIARVLGKDEKSTDNALQRAKAKIKKQMKQTGVTF